MFAEDPTRHQNEWCNQLRLQGDHRVHRRFWSRGITRPYKAAEVELIRVGRGHVSINQSKVMRSQTDGQTDGPTGTYTFAGSLAGLIINTGSGLESSEFQAQNTRPSTGQSLQSLSRYQGYVHYPFLPFMATLRRRYYRQKQSLFPLISTLFPHSYKKFISFRNEVMSH